MQVKSILVSLSALSAAHGAAIGSRAVVNHDSINPLPESVQGGPIGAAIRKFEPLLHIAHGCQSYPAVDAQGNTSGGLQDSGSSTGGCRDQAKGQTYARAVQRGDRLAIMYAWYFPKDMPNSGIRTGAHRHDWENVVIFVQNDAIVAGGASGHGNYKKTTAVAMEGSRPKVEYFTNFPTNHELQFSGTVGRDLPLLDWDTMSQPMKDALTNTDFGAANVPFKDSNFISNIDKASN